MEQAAREGAEIVCFPECCITGYWFLRNLNREAFAALAEPVCSGPSSRFLMELAKKHGMTIGAGLVERGDDGCFYNTFVVAMPNGEFRRHRKLHTFVSEFLSDGNEYTVFDTPQGCRVGVLIDPAAVEVVLAPGVDHQPPHRRQFVGAEHGLGRLAERRPGSLKLLGLHAIEEPLLRVPGPPGPCAHGGQEDGGQRNAERCHRRFSAEKPAAVIAAPEARKGSDNRQRHSRIPPSFTAHQRSDAETNIGPGKENLSNRANPLAVRGTGPANGERLLMWRFSKGTSFWCSASVKPVPTPPAKSKRPSQS